VALFLASACGGGDNHAPPPQPTSLRPTGALDPTPATSAIAPSTSVTGSATGRPSVTVVAIAGTPGLITLTPSGAKPETLSVQSGRTITWQNDDTNRHHIVSDEPGLFDTGDIAPGSSVTVTVTVIGTHDWHDMVTPGLKGTLRVLQ
jgi:plastocyanin